MNATGPKLVDYWSLVQFELILLILKHADFDSFVSFLLANPRWYRQLDTKSRLALKSTVLSADPRGLVRACKHGLTDTAAAILLYNSFSTDSNIFTLQLGGMTALHWACFHGSLVVVTQILRSSNFINCRGNINPQGARCRGECGWAGPSLTHCPQSPPGHPLTIGTRDGLCRCEYDDRANMTIERKEPTFYGPTKARHK